MLLEQRGLPCRQQLTVFDNRLEPVRDQGDVEREIHRHQRDRQRDGVVEPFQEDGAEHEEQRHRDRHRMPEPRGGQRVFDQVRRGVGSRQRDGDDEAGGGETQQAQDDNLSLPPWEEVLEHQDAALAVGAHLRDAVVHGQCAEQGEQYENQRRNRRQRARSDERDARLIRERRKIVHARETHDLPPPVRVGGPDVRSDRLFVPLVHPVVDAPFGERSGEGGPEGGIQDLGNLPCMPLLPRTRSIEHRSQRTSRSV